MSRATYSAKRIRKVERTVTADGPTDGPFIARWKARHPKTRKIEPADARAVMAAARLAIEEVMKWADEPQDFMTRQRLMPAEEWASAAFYAATAWMREAEEISSGFVARAPQETLAKLWVLATWAREAADEAKRVIEEYKT